MWDKSVNWWATKIISLLAFIYLVFSLLSPPKAEDSKALENEHIILFTVILLFNSDLLEKIESFSFGDLNAKFATKEEVNKLGDQIDILLLSTVLDAFDFITLQKIVGEREDDSFELTEERGKPLLEKLRNRGLVKEKQSELGSIFYRDTSGTSKINLREYFSITAKGKEYMQVIMDKELKHKLEDIAVRAGYREQ